MGAGFGGAGYGGSGGGGGSDFVHAWGFINYNSLTSGTFWPWVSESAALAGVDNGVGRIGCGPLKTLNRIIVFHRSLGPPSDLIINIFMDGSIRASPNFGTLSGTQDLDLDVSGFTTSTSYINCCFVLLGASDSSTRRPVVVMEGTY